MRPTSNRWDCGDEKGDRVLVTEENEWEIRNDAETLMRAKAIMEDEKRLGKVKDYFKKQKEAIEDLSSDEFYEKLIGLR